ncbi:hypothetical protein D5S18_25200 [Nocardia panacis]|uniref:Uncharacterized protein n=1 Tax=Nocardia panacis TaxID=2340916 RepID=A0A3A4KP40_9NOCA|nr:toxin glutamine deamidase domain-containing protein [Nocardia panacis]RJO71465.1 hypothetical protein D5S18_25200 [Nocardia panacis]
MGVEIPGPLQWVAKYVVGAGDWPEGDETAMRRIAHAWEALHTALDGIDHDAEKTMLDALIALDTGETHDAMSQYWSKVGGKSGLLPVLIADTKHRAEDMKSGATDIEHTKFVIIGALTIFAIQLVQALALAATGVGSLAAAAEEAVAQVATRVAIRMAIKQLLQKLLSRAAARVAAKAALQGALQGTAADLGASLLQIAQHNKSGLSGEDWANLGREAVSGAVAGVVGAGLGSGGAASPLAGAIESKAGRIVSTAAVDGAAGAVGAVAGTAATVPLGGKFEVDPTTLLTSSVAGAAGTGAAHEVGAKVHEVRNSGSEVVAPHSAAESRPTGADATAHRDPNAGAAQSSPLANDNAAPASAGDRPHSVSADMPSAHGSDTGGAVGPHGAELGGGDQLRATSPDPTPMHGSDTGETPKTHETGVTGGDRPSSASVPGHDPDGAAQPRSHDAGPAVAGSDHPRIASETPIVQGLDGGPNVGAHSTAAAAADGGHPHAADSNVAVPDTGSGRPGPPDSGAAMAPQADGSAAHHDSGPTSLSPTPGSHEFGGPAHGWSLNLPGLEAEPLVSADHTGSASHEGGTPSDHVTTAGIADAPDVSTGTRVQMGPEGLDAGRRSDASAAEAPQRPGTEATAGHPDLAQRPESGQAAQSSGLDHSRAGTAAPRSEGRSTETAVPRQDRSNSPSEASKPHEQRSTSREPESRASHRNSPLRSEPTSTHSEGARSKWGSLNLPDIDPPTGTSAHRPSTQAHRDTEPEPHTPAHLDTAPEKPVDPSANREPSSSEQTGTSRDADPGQDTHRPDQPSVPHEWEPVDERGRAGATEQPESRNRPLDDGPDAPVLPHRQPVDPWDTRLHDDRVLVHAEEHGMLPEDVVRDIDSGTLELRPRHLHEPAAQPDYIESPERITREYLQEVAENKVLEPLVRHLYANVEPDKFPAGCPDSELPQHLTRSMPHDALNDAAAQVDPTQMYVNTRGSDERPVWRDRSAGGEFLEERNALFRMDSGGPEVFGTGFKARDLTNLNIASHVGSGRADGFVSLAKSPERTILRELSQMGLGGAEALPDGTFRQIRYMHELYHPYGIDVDATFIDVSRGDPMAAYSMKEAEILAPGGISGDQIYRLWPREVIFDAKGNPLSVRVGDPIYNPNFAHLDNPHFAATRDIPEHLRGSSDPPPAPSWPSHEQHAALLREFRAPGPDDDYVPPSSRESFEYPSASHDPRMYRAPESEPPRPPDRWHSEPRDHVRTFDRGPEGATNHPQSTVPHQTSLGPSDTRYTPPQAAPPLWAHQDPNPRTSMLPDWWPHPDRPAVPHAPEMPTADPPSMRAPESLPPPPHSPPPRTADAPPPAPPESSPRDRAPHTADGPARDQRGTEHRAPPLSERGQAIGPRQEPQHFSRDRAPGAEHDPHPARDFGPQPRHHADTPERPRPVDQETENALQSRKARESYRQRMPEDNRVIDVPGSRAGHAPGYEVRRYTIGPEQQVAVAQVRVHLVASPHLSPQEMRQLIENAHLATDRTFNSGHRLLSGDWLMVDIAFTADPSSAHLLATVDHLPNPHSWHPGDRPEVLIDRIRDQLGLPDTSAHDKLDPADLRQLSNDIARANTPAKFRDIHQDRVFAEHLLQPLENPEFQAAVEDALRDGNRFMVGADPRTNPYGQLINDGGQHFFGRGNNCLDLSLAALSSFHGDPRVGVPRWLDLLSTGKIDMNGELGGADRAARILRGDWLSFNSHGRSIPEQFNALHDYIKQMGPGSSALVGNFWHARDRQTGEFLYDHNGWPVIDGGHATTLVYPYGADGPVWWDPQSNQTSARPPAYLIDDSAHLQFIANDANGGTYGVRNDSHQGAGPKLSGPDLPLSGRVPDRPERVRLGMPESVDAGGDRGRSGDGPRELRDQRPDRHSEHVGELASAHGGEAVRRGDSDRTTGPAKPDLSTEVAHEYSADPRRRPGDPVFDRSDLANRPTGTGPRQLLDDHREANPVLQPARPDVGPRGGLGRPAEPVERNLAGPRDIRVLDSMPRS